MKKYNLENLKEGNFAYMRSYGIREEDVILVNKLVDIFTTNLSKNDSPKDGDIIHYTNEYGEYYENAHVETTSSYDNGEIMICQQAYTPFVTLSLDKISISASGGSWTKIEKAECKRVGTAQKKFCVWGVGGPRTDGALIFEAPVNVWEYSKNKYKYSTEKYDKYNVYINEDVGPNDRYKYHLRNSSGLGTHAFKTDQEFSAWMKTFKGIEEKSNSIDKNIIVWTLKQNSICLPLEKYEAIDCEVIDSTLCNGKLQECKRVYKDNCVTTYIPYQHCAKELSVEHEFERMYAKNAYRSSEELRNYEKNTFYTIFNDNKKHNGKTFKVIREKTNWEYDREFTCENVNSGEKTEVLQRMFVIEFKDGERIDAFEEEINNSYREQQK